VVSGQAEVVWLAVFEMVEMLPTLSVVLRAKAKAVPQERLPTVIPVVGGVGSPLA
jgi:hypothetical protein